MGSMPMIIMIIVLFGGMIFFQARSQKKRVRAQEEFRASLKKGDPVMTSSGLIGKVVSIDKDENTAVIESHGTKSCWTLQALTQGQGSVPSNTSSAKDEEETPAKKPAKKTTAKKS